MDEKAMLELGRMLCISNTLTWKFPFIRKMSAEEIKNHYEFQKFKSKYPEISRLIEN